jgi:hypothetical protein
LSYALRGVSRAERAEEGLVAGNEDSGNPTKPVWRAPKVDDIGNLRDFVKTSDGHTKSGSRSDDEGGSEKRNDD